jgi:tRNA A-37 threonylcarbamoyl transferase component Bud32
MPLHSEHRADGVPRRIGDYFIHRRIGEGGMGIVYEAEEELTHRRVAIKVLQGELDRSERGRRQFVSEMSILASLDDPHIVRCLHCADIEGQLIMVLEYLEGQTLRELLKTRGCLSWTEVAGIAWQIASALRTAHSHKPAIVHRDLKPENVMCLPDGRIKVMDFGIAKILATLASSTTSQSIGTLQYMSPEQIDAHSLDGRSDLFTLGLVMWEMLAGWPPFRADSPRVLLEKICTEPTPALPEHARQGVPPELQRLIGWLLAKDASARPHDVTQVTATLEAMRPVAQVPVAAPQPMAAPIPGPVPNPSRSASAPRMDTIAIVQRASRGPDKPYLVPVLIAAVVGVVAMLVGVGWAIQGSRSADPDKPSPDPARADVTSTSGAAVAKPAVCTAPENSWAGAWTLHTEATQASQSSWIGGRGTYELILEVEGCRLVGSGHKIIEGEKTRPFEATGDVNGAGVATLRYAVIGRDIAGTWSLTQAGTGSWRSAAGDVSGTVTISRGAP